jgi:DNA-binding transcriptional ArsR family regulator
MAYGNGIAALGDSTRRTIFELLGDGPRSVGDLAGELPVSRPAVSQHLKVLKDAGLVSESRVGTRRVYRVEPDAVAELRTYFDEFWTQALAAFKTAAESELEGEQHGSN